MTLDEPTIGPEERIADYVLRHPLGRGGMGEVWLAHDPTLDRELAVKFLPDAVAANPEVLERFLREARAAARLNHPNTITIYQVGDDDGRVFIAMEYAPGGSLDAFVKNKGPMPWRDATRAVRDAALGLGAAHEMSMIHRDIKPGNLMWDARKRIKVADFGLVRALQDDSDLTIPGRLLGTPTYMAPEQGRGDPVDGRSDLYSLACTFYVLLTAKRPFTGDNSTAVLYQHEHSPFPNPQTITPAVPDDIAAIIKHATNKKPEDRFQSAQDMADALDAVLAGRALPAFDALDDGDLTITQPNLSDSNGSASASSSGVSTPKATAAALIAEARRHLTRNEYNKAVETATKALPLGCARDKLQAFLDEVDDARFDRRETIQELIARARGCVESRDADGANDLLDQAKQAMPAQDPYFQTFEDEIRDVEAAMRTIGAG